MPFPSAVKARIFVRCARICCLCFKQTGARIEAAHIIAEADGGSNEDENAIPLCFDCHEEIGSYNPHHPKGNKFTPEELVQRRDALYQLVERGIIQAQIIATRLGLLPQISGNQSVIQSIERETSAPSYVPSKDAQTILSDTLKLPGRVETFPRKLSLLSRADRAFVLEYLVDNFDQRSAAEALMNVVGSDLASDESLILLEKVIRQATLKADSETLAMILELAPLDRMLQVDEGLREILFLDIISIMNHDQYEEVNRITPSVVRVQSALPKQVRASYVNALLKQADSGAWKGAPAARAALSTLPSELLDEAFSLVDEKMLWSNWQNKPLRTFLENCRSSWPVNRRFLFDDFFSLKMFDFADKYLGKEI